MARFLLWLNLKLNISVTCVSLLNKKTKFQLDVGADSIFNLSIAVSNVWKIYEGASNWRKWNIQKYLEQFQDNGWGCNMVYLNTCAVLEANPL